MTDSPPSNRRDAYRRRRSLGWSRALLAVGVVAVLLCLAAANVLRAGWTEAEDGVLWIERPAGLVAAEISPGSPAVRAGLVPGDVLLAVDGVPVESLTALLEVLHAGGDGATRGYSVLRLGRQELHELALEILPGGRPRLYLVLVAIGVFTLLIGTSVRLRRPDNQATLHFFWLTVAFFGVFAFSFSGRLDRLDWVFYWADAVSMLLLAPLFMHFALVFPARSPSSARRRLGTSVLAPVYFPALALAAAEIAVLAGPGAGPRFTGAVELVWQLEIAYLAACAVGGLVIMIRALRRAPSVTARLQLRWVLSGAVLGGLPFTLGYAVPWAFGFDSDWLHLTAVTLVLIPLAFAAAIVRYRLGDVEVIVKRGLVYAGAVAAMAAIYLLLEGLATAVFWAGRTRTTRSSRSWRRSSWCCWPSRSRTRSKRCSTASTTGTVTTIAGPWSTSRGDLNSDLDLDRLAERLVTRVAETLVVDRMVLLQGADGGGAVQWRLSSGAMDRLRDAAAAAGRRRRRHRAAAGVPHRGARRPRDRAAAGVERRRVLERSRALLLRALHCRRRNDCRDGAGPEDQRRGR